MMYQDTLSELNAPQAAELTKSIKICFGDWLAGRWTGTDFLDDVLPALIAAWEAGYDPAYELPGKTFYIEEDSGPERWWQVGDHRPIASRIERASGEQSRCSSATD